MEHRGKVVQLLKYLAEYNSSSQKVTQSIDEQLWFLPLDGLSSYADGYVTIGSRNSTNIDEEPEEEDFILLEVKNPEHTPFADAPGASFAQFVDFDWRDYAQAPVFKDGMGKIANIESKEWLKEWKAWAKAQQKIENTRNLYLELYNQYAQLRLNGENMEILAANGFVRSSLNPSLNHPVIMKRVNVDYDADKDIVSIRDTSARTELYTLCIASLNAMEDDLVSQEALGAFAREADDEFFHPFDAVKTYAFLEKTIQLLNPAGKVVPYGKSLKEEDILTLSFLPVFFMRRKPSDAIRFINEAIHQANIGYPLPQSLCDITGHYVHLPKKTAQKTISESLAEASGEDPSIFFPLVANREQLEIARRIERFDSVLVQGPPGTGKTHTIANLIGHFLSKGKRILVTSHTKKALSVLKSMVPEGLRSLCVSLLDDDNSDMEKSVGNIIEYMSSYRSDELKGKVETYRRRRQEILAEMHQLRSQIYNIKSNEYLHVTYGGIEYSLSDMAKYVHANNIYGSIIPGRVDESESMPLDSEELAELYATNGILSASDEIEFEIGLPDTTGLMSPDEFDRLRHDIVLAEKTINDSASRLGYVVVNDDGLCLKSENGTITLSDTTEEALDAMEHELESYMQSGEPWVVSVAADGKTGGVRANAWQQLLTALKRTEQLSMASYEELLGKNVVLPENADTDELLGALERVEQLYVKKTKLNGITRMMNGKDIALVEDGVKINGKRISSQDDCQIAMRQVEINLSREDARQKWNALMGKSGARLFDDMDPRFPEHDAVLYVPLIERYLGWFDNEYPTLRDHLRACGIDPDDLFMTSPFDSDAMVMRAYFEVIRFELPLLLKIQREILKYNELLAHYNELRQIVDGYPASSALCRKLRDAVSSFHAQHYGDAYNTLNTLHGKHEAIETRARLLAKLRNGARDWASAIKGRKGIHGKPSVPEHIGDVWKWKQFYQILRHSNEVSFNGLQEKNSALSHEYRRITELYTQYSAWLELIKKCENDREIQQALNGWRLVTKRIGKGTGKNAPKYRRQARELMKKCQESVPVWIMTVGQIYENLTPGSNIYDVLIIDEASQCDITSLSIMMLAKKVIVVGDDSQVSPLGIGVDASRIDGLLNSYIKDIIPNYVLYTARTSLYDIVSQTFHPLMLKEHFRCVPDIIGFSNMLSYDYKIHPLRDSSSSSLLPAVVPYHVAGQRNVRKRVNEIEADAVAFLIERCLSDPAYESKTFGVISMMGDEQARLIRSKVDMEPSVMERHQLLFGTPAQFQGDERDVIILSLVDSPSDSLRRRTVHKSGQGVDNSFKKRFNVAASRAKDQLWIIHSLDMEKDLKDGDIRKSLLAYAANPMAFLPEESRAEPVMKSPFEEAVSRSLEGHGYEIRDHWRAGSYFIDIVVIDGNNKVAVECDGERWDSREDKVFEDMERQTILERVGWRFVRIRGSEYYAEPSLTMERLFSELGKLGIHPNSIGTLVDNSLVSAIKADVDARLMDMHGKEKDSQ